MGNILSFEVKKFDVKKMENDQFLYIDFFAISEGINRNKSSFSLNSLYSAIPSVINKPVLAQFKNDDFTHHAMDVKYDKMTGGFYDDYENGERAIGVIPESSNVRIESVNGKNWMRFSAVLWTEYSYRGVELLKKRRSNKVSVEIKVTSSFYDKDGIENIESFELLGITLLGNAVTEGISGAHLDLIEFAESKEFSQYREALCFALNNKESFISKDEIGTSSALTIDTSKDSMSTSPWGDVDKSKLKKDCLMASNYTSICPKVFLKLESDWKSGIEGDLGYPVMQKVDGKLVYNKYGISSAEAYATKNNETGVLKKIKSLKKKLGLDEKSKKEETEDMAKKFSIADKEYLLFAKNDKYAFLVEVSENKFYAHPALNEGENFEDEKLEEFDMVAKMESEEMEIDMCKFVEEPDENTDSSDEEYAAKLCEMEEKFKALEDEKKSISVRMEEVESEKKVAEENFAKMSEEKKQLEENFAKMSEELKECKMSEFNKAFDQLMEDERYSFDQSVFEKITTMKKEEKFSDIESVKKEIAYEKYKKEEAIKASKKSEFKQNIVNPSKNNVTNLFDEITESVKKSK